MPVVKNKFYYRGILKKAYQIVKGNKFLWVFGFFAAALGGVGELESVFKNYSDIGASSDNIFGLQTLYQGGVIWTIFDNIQDFFASFPWQAFFLLLITAVVFIVVIWLAIISQIALFDASNKLSKNKKTGYAESYRVGNKKFGSVLLINVVAKIVLWGVFVVIAAPLLGWFLIRDNVWGAILFVVLLFFVFIPISIIVSFIIKYAIAFIVIKGQKTWEAVKSSWVLFKKYWLVSIEMALIILVIGLGVGLFILLLIGLVSVPFVLIGIAALFFGSSTGLAVAVILGTVAWFVVIAIVGSAFASFQYTTWTLLFLDLVGDKAESKIKRFIDRFIKK
ncbi:MAG: hypothetical protein ACNFW9_06130 [Candidatus Kerfeldbacteria bacterium]